MLSKSDEMLIEVPSYLYKNPPKPRREDIAKLFNKIVKDEDRRKFYIYRNDDEDFYRILNNECLFGVIRVKEADIYDAVKLVSRNLDPNINYKVRNPLRSKYIKLLSKKLGITQSERLEIGTIKNNGRVMIRMVFSKY